MVCILSVASLALAVLSAVSAHVIRRHSPPKGWQAAILESYDEYHHRYMDLKCYEKHNTTFFHQCCHPLLKDESPSVLYDRKCFSTAYEDDGCDDGNSSTVMSSSPEHKTPTSPPPMYSPESPTPTSSPPVHTTSPAVQHKLAEPDPLETSSSPETSSTPETTPTKASSPSPSPAGPFNADKPVITGGFATYYTQNGNAGACGETHSDDDFIAAIDQAQYGDSHAVSPLCGKQVKILNLRNNHTVVVTIKDDCPTCVNGNSIDLSVAAFKTLDALSVGQLHILWQFIP